MNNNLLFATGLLLVCACSCSPKVPQGEFRIVGKLTNVPDSAVINLSVLTSSMIKTIASDTVINGEFSFSDTITTGPRKLALLSSSDGFPGVWIEPWVASGELVTVTGSDKLLPTWLIESDIPQQADQNRFNAVTATETKEFARLMVEEYDLQRLMFRDHASDREFSKACWLKIDSLRKISWPLRDSINCKEIEYMKTAPISEVWMDKLADHARILSYEPNSPLVPNIKELYARLSESDRQTDIGLEIGEYMTIGPVVNVGDDMVDGDLFDTDGKLHHLAEFKGKYILLDFWGQGCGPCIQSIPEMEEVAELYKDKMTVVAINGDPKEDWRSFVAERGMKGIQLNELRKGRNTGLAAQYRTAGIPHYVMIAPDGKITDIWSGYGPGSLKRKLNELVK